MFLPHDLDGLLPYCTNFTQRAQGTLHERLLTRLLFGQETGVEGGLSDCATTCPTHVHIDSAQENSISFYKFIDDSFPSIRGVCRAQVLYLFFCWVIPHLHNNLIGKGWT